MNVLPASSTTPRVPLLTGVVLAAALPLAGCSAPTTGSSAPVAAALTDGEESTAAAAPGQDGDGEVVIAIGTEPDTLHPALGYARWGDGTVTEGLLELDADLELAPLLAEDLPAISEDGLTYTYTLREGVTFHDGSPLEAEDVAFTYEAALDPDNASPAQADLTSLDAVEATDARTVTFTLTEPHASFPVATVLGIVPAPEDGSTDLSDAGHTVIGTGPYRLDSFRPGDRMVLTANEDYWGEVPEVRRATFLIAGDDAARAARLAAGEIDGTLLPATALSRFEGDEAFEVVRRDTADFRALVMPEEGPVTGDAAIRRALHTGLDREQLVAGALAGAGRPAYGPIPPEAPEYSPVLETDADLEGAREALTEAGWVEGEDGIRQRDGERASFTLMYPAGDAIRQNVALDVEAQAAQLGIEVVPEGLSWDAIEPRMRTDALVYGTGNAFNADLSTYPLFHSSRAYVGYDNPGGYADPGMDAALEAGRAAGDEQDRVRAYQDVQEHLAEDLPWIFLAYVGHDYVIRSGAWDGYDVDLVEPHEHGIHGGPWWNLPDWTVAG